jgi:hypothetical protein
VQARLIKASGEDGVAWFHRIILATWHSLLGGPPPLPACAPRKGIPDAWRKVDLINLFKSKDRSQCPNYRGISLVSVAGKVHTLVLKRRLEACLGSTISPTQFGFRPDRGTNDAIFCLRRLQEAALRQRSPLFVAYIDLRRAFDTVSREGLWALLSAHGVDPGLIALIQDLYADNQVSVKVGSSRSPPITPTLGVRQGCPLSPLLFNLFIDLVARRMEGLHPDLGVSARCRLDGDRYTYKSAPPRSALYRLLQILYADDMALIASSAAELRTLLLSLESVFGELGLTINYDKTKFQQLGDPAFSLRDCPSSIELAGGSISIVFQFKYLGSIMASIAPDTPCGKCGERDAIHPVHGAMLLCDSPGCLRGFHLKCLPQPLDNAPATHWACPCCPPLPPNFTPEPPPVAHPLDAEISARLSSAASANGRLAKIWRVPHRGPSPSITLYAKLQFYHAFVISSLTYACQTWTLLEAHLARLSVFHNSCLRSIKQLPWDVSTTVLHGADRPNSHTHIQTHPISNWLLQFRLSFLGHLARKDDGYIPKAMLSVFELVHQGSGARLPQQPDSAVINKRYSDMAHEALTQLEHARPGLKAALGADTDLWLRLAANRLWWHNEMVKRARCPAD